jgi:hypothetical protein
MRTEYRVIRDTDGELVIGAVSFDGTTPISWTNAMVLGSDFRELAEEIGKMRGALLLPALHAKDIK